MANLLSTIVSGGSGTTPTLVLDRNIATPSNYYNGVQLEVKATSGTAGISLHRSGYSHVGIFHDSTNELKFNMNSGTPVLLASTGTIWGSGNDGSGSGLDADLIDGNHASAFATRQDGARYTTDFNSILSSGFFNAEGQPANAPDDYGQLIVAKGVDTGLQIFGGYDSNNLWFRGWGYGPEANGFYPWRKIWHDGNDGSGSGLDADLLDGIESSRIVYGGVSSRQGVTQISDWNQTAFPNAAFLSSESSTANAPTTDYTYGLQTSFHRNGPEYRTQFVTSLYGNNVYWLRQFRDSAAWSPWVQVIHSGNIGAQSVSYAASAGVVGTADYAVTAGDASSVGGYTFDQGLRTGNSPTFANVYASEWFRNYGNQGIYNQTYGTHFYSNSAEGFVVTGSGGIVQLQFRSNHQSTIRGYVYADTSNNIGFLNDGGSWALRMSSSRNAEIFGSDLTIGSGGANATNIIMGDNDEGSRTIHCNSNRIGFLNQSASWGSWCDDDGGWNSVGNISGNYLYSNSSVRVGEIWGFGGLYRSSGAMLFGTENDGWSFRSGNSEKVYIATDGNIYMAWAGAYISTLLDAKQNASTAITTSNIGSQSVNFASQTNAINITGYGSGNMTYYQTPGTFAGHSGWAGYFVSNHGDGATYYNQTIIMPFWEPPKYSRLEGGTLRGPYTFWSTENMDAPNKSGTSYYQTNNWMQFNGYYGLYWPSHFGAHFHTNDGSTYTQFKLQGNKNGYSGIYDDHSRVNGFMYGDDGSGGVYREANGLWYFYYHLGNNCMGIGTSTTSSSYKLYVNGTIYATGDVIAYSDSRKKTNIVTIDNALNKVLSMRGVFYNKLDEPQNGRQVGVIAQEVNEVLPEAVNYASDVDEYGVKYGNIVGVLIEAIKEQQAQIDELKAKLDGLTK